MTAMIEDTFYRYIEGMDPFHLESMWRKVYGSGFSMRQWISGSRTTTAVRGW